MLVTSRPFPRAGGSAGEKIGRWCRWMPTTRSHFLSALESGFNPVLDQIQHLAENGLTSMMVLHDFLSGRLEPLQDRPAHPAWMYIRVNHIMRLERSPGPSLDEALLAACLKTLMADQFLADLVVPVAVCEPT
jgi:hypothetical protein